MKNQKIENLKNLEIENLEDIQKLDNKIISFTCSCDPTGTNTILCVRNSGTFFPTIIILLRCVSKGSRTSFNFNCSITNSGSLISNLPVV